MFFADPLLSVTTLPTLVEMSLKHDGSLLLAFLIRLLVQHVSSTLRHVGEEQRWSGKMASFFRSGANRLAPAVIQPARAACAAETRLGSRPVTQMRNGVEHCTAVASGNCVVRAVTDTL